MPVIIQIMKAIIKLILLSFIGLIATDVYAANQAPFVMCQQPQQEGRPREPKFNPKQFHKELAAFIACESGMTANEAKAFMPIYFEMKEKLRAIERQKGSAIGKAANQNMSERDCKRVLADVGELDKKQHRLEAQYQVRLMRIVGAKKLIKAFDADRSFGRRLFRKMTR